MRDPKRITEILGLIEQIWQSQPDLRFQQLMYILQAEYSKLHQGLGKVEAQEADSFTRTAYDLFNLDDDKFQGYLQQTIDNGDWGKGI